MEYHFEDDPNGLGALWNAEMHVLEVFDAACKENGLCYYAAYGTALGAVRHGGFIPWDDDVDLVMPRPDYNRFIKEANKILPQHLKLVTYKNTPEFNGQIFCKIQDSRVDVVEEVARKSGCSVRGGVFLDVFPLDACGNWSILTNRYFGAAYSIAYSFIYRHFKSTCMMRFCDAIAQLRRWVACDTVGVFEANLGRFTTRMPRKSLDGIRTIKFNGFDLPIPIDVEDHLTSYYGDYMKLPPEADRRVTHGSGGLCPWRLGPTTTRPAF